jgi:hypothetical protein
VPGLSPSAAEVPQIADGIAAAQRTGNECQIQTFPWRGPNPFNPGRKGQARREHLARWHLLSHVLAQCRA